jgi:HD-like signal output (HDOD) protein
MDPNALVKPTIDREQILKVAASMGLLGAGVHSGPRMMALLCNPQVSEREVATLIYGEPAIYARVLRVANSVYYGQSRSVTTIERAMPLLGLDSVRGIAAAASLDRTVVLGGAGTKVDLQALLSHSLATAAAAESLARIGHRPLASEAFIAGLLHNLGVPVQIQIDAPGIEAMIQARQIDGTRDIRLLESESAAVGHEECIAAVFESWQLPDSLVAAVRYHHDPISAPAAHRNMAALVNLGAHLALASGYTYPLEPAPGECSAAVMAQLQLAVEDVEGVAAELPVRAARLRSALLAA